MMILGDGNVGIGTSSPSTYDSRSNNLVVGDSGDSGITIFSGATSNARLQFAPSGSTGLDNGLIDYDNNNDSMSFATGGSERMRIDSSGNVGIGTSSPSTMLHLSAGTTNGQGGSHAGITMTNKYDNPDNSWSIRPSIDGVSNTGLEIRDVTDNRSVMVFDGSGNVLVGKTALDNTTVGIRMNATGDASFVADGNRALVLNRKSSDGDMALFLKDGTTVGSIGVQGTNDLTLHSTTTGHKGLRLGEGYYIPTNNSGSPEDNSVDIGMTSYRYKNVHAVNYYGDGSNLTGVGGSTTFGAVGTYVYAYYSANLQGSGKASAIAGDTYAGSYMYPAGSILFGINTLSANNRRDTASHSRGSTALSGTWRCMGNETSTDIWRPRITLYLRIS
jgi:hypothetical protein